MKNLFFILFFCANFVFAQNTIPTDTISQKLGRDAVPSVKEALISFTIWDIRGRPMKNISIYFHSKTEIKVYKAITNLAGKVRFLVPNNQTYSLEIDGIKDYEIHKIPNRPNFRRNLSFTFDREEAIKKAAANQVNKTGVLDTIFISNKQKRLKSNELKVKIKVKDEKGIKYSDVRISLLCKSINKIFIAYTNRKGEANFHLPNDNLYTVGLDENEKYDEFVLPKLSGAMLIRDYFYRPDRIKDIRENDTIRQNLVGKIEPTSKRVYLHILVKDLDRQILQNEDVYLDVLNDSLVYTAKTNSQGIAKLLLPKKHKYTLNFKYEREIDLLDYSEIKGFRETQIQFHYIGSKRVEDFYKKTKRTKEGFFTEFIKSKVKPRKAVKSKYYKKTKEGYELDFEGSSPTSTPAIVQDKLFVGGGFYTKEFYCIDAKTGDYIWGVELADNGPSAVVYEDDVVLINTESCTLYAFNANNGRLLWSKRLGTTLFSTPSVYNGKVFSVYPNYYSNDGNDFVAAAFDLKTGKIIWQKWLDGEVVGSPVINEKYIYLTTTNGSLYLFENKTGKQIKKVEIQAITPPTIVDDNLYITVKNKTKQEVALFDANSLKLKTKFKSLSDRLYYKNSRNLSSARRLCYNGSRITHYKGLNYNVINENLFCSNPKTGNVIWQKKIGVEKKGKNPLACLPIITKGKILVSTIDGKILLFNSKNGNLIEEKSTNNILYSQPILHKGSIYTGTKEGKFVVLNTRNKSFYDGWKMWNFNAQHNPVIK